jgi:hypothetical protein
MLDRHSNILCIGDHEPKPPPFPFPAGCCVILPNRRPVTDDVMVLCFVINKKTLVRRRGDNARQDAVSKQGEGREDQIERQEESERRTEDIKPEELHVFR